MPTWDKGPAYVERRKLRPHDAIALIGQSGGVPILAHPGLLQNLTILPSLKEAGLSAWKLSITATAPGKPSAT